MHLGEQLKQSRSRRRVVLMAVLGVLVSALALNGAPAQAAEDQKISYVKRVTPIQSTNTYVAIRDAHDRKYTMKVTATWKYLSSTRATLRTLVIRGHDFPSGKCVMAYSWIPRANWDSNRNLALCEGGLLTYSVGKTLKTYSGNNLGQFHIQTPDPAAPGEAGAKTATIEYHIAS